MIISRKTSTRAMSNRHEPQNNSNGEIKEATIYLYGNIGGWWGIDHLDWIQEFNAIDADVIHLRIASEGGDVFAARAMKTAVMQHKAKVIAHIDGLAASAASFLAMGADEIEIVDGGFFMIHNATSLMDILGYFNINDLEDLLKEIDKEKVLHEKINESIANDYAKAIKADKDQIITWMEAETWFTAQESLDYGFADRIYDGTPVEGSYDLSIFANAPEALKRRNQMANKRTIEKALRDAGCSKQKAKSILKEGYKDELVDETEVPLRDVVDLPIIDEGREAPVMIDAVNPVNPIVPEEHVPAVVIADQIENDPVAKLLSRAEALAPSKTHLTLQEILNA